MKWNWRSKLFEELMDRTMEQDVWKGAVLSTLLGGSVLPGHVHCYPFDLSRKMTEILNRMIEAILMNQRENGTRDIRTKMTAMHYVKDREDRILSLEESLEKHIENVVRKDSSQSDGGVKMFTQPLSDAEITRLIFGWG